MSDWISVEDRLPDEEGPYLVYDVDDDNTVMFFAGGEWGYEYVVNPYNVMTGAPVFKITNWMPLPGPPTENSDEKRT